MKALSRGCAVGVFAPSGSNLAALDESGDAYRATGRALCITGATAGIVQVDQPAG